MKPRVTSQCLKCGAEYTETIGWFKRTLKAKKMACPKCGGEIDFKPIAEAAKAALTALKAQLK